ncbi:Peptidyl-prolyl cis-trans isomerase-like 4 [Trichinella pseudospiralis]|uniref:Peptidyl-prolyl cis-trans isomerase n=1 Tax=Trichinella pseudospiralis TaxID=6337 RepID=A0A0V0XVK2_TRIPS|nr:Peptidyl-prolyl cis-trans isomerase-like 4 [Trichinella pseudospiralis]
MSVLIETTIGDFVVDLYIKERPKTSMNFLKLCKLKYYNFSLFHTIQQNFIAQAGDPTETGRGARFFEMEAVPLLNHTKRGCLSMVNNGDNMHGSQFFLTLDEDLKYLNGVHTVFGEITEGFDILEKLNDAICDKDNHPFQDIRIMHTIILDDPFPDPDGVDFPSRSPSPDERLLEVNNVALLTFARKSGRIGVDEEVDEMKNKPEEEIAELIAAKEARTQAHILEMVGDLHYAEEKPPDNVLFVCKLNAVTTEDDLEVIFGRFGPILSCEVIRDRKTGDSLQYAFIEFADVKACNSVDKK